MTEVRVGASSMRALKAFLSHPVGALKVNDRLVFEAAEGGGVNISVLPENVNISQHGEDLTSAYSPQDPAEPEPPI